MITGGGTGGHTSPAVAIIEELQRRDPQLSLQWVGRRGNIEERVAKGLGIPFRHVPVEGWPRGKNLRKLLAAAKLGIGIANAAMYIRRFRPQLILGVGGYVSLPLLWAGQRLGVPTLVHEQNKRLGMANRMLAAKATRILLSYPDTVGNFPQERARVVGNPVRSGFASPPSREDACTRFGLDPAIPVVLICGGSQGAKTLNTAVTGMLKSIARDELQLIWMTGQRDAAEARTAAKDAVCKAFVFPFIDDMVGACAASDLIVTRSGASTTAEIAVLGKATVLVPYPFATDNHQEANARAFEHVGAARVLLDNACDAATLLGAIRELVGAPSMLQDMARASKTLARPNAAEMIVDEVFGIVFEK